MSIVCLPRQFEYINKDILLNLIPKRKVVGKSERALNVNIYLGCGWAVRGLFFPWHAHGDESKCRSMDCSESVHGLPVGCPWAVRVPSAGCPRALRGYFFHRKLTTIRQTDCQWAVRVLSMACTRTFRGPSVGCEQSVGCELSMGCLWTVRGQPMKIPQKAPGQFADSPSGAREQSTDSPQTTHDQLADSPRIAREKPMDCLLISMGLQGPCSGCLLTFHGLSTLYMGCPWAVRALSIDCPWAVHGPSVGCSWAVHGLSMGCSWDSMGRPWSACELSIGCPVGGISMGCSWATR